MNTWQSGLGIIALFSIAWLFSSNKRAVNWRTVLFALFLQIALGALALGVPAGRAVFEKMAHGFSTVLDYANTGIDFLFGSLASTHHTGFVFAISVLSVIIFFSSLLSVLYHLGIMQFVIRFFGGLLGKILGVSRVESMYAVANLFLGQSESPLAIKPHIAGLTRSQMFTILTCGMSTVAGSVLAGYVKMGIEMKYLITAIFMSAPGALVISKLMIPETENKEDNPIDIQYDRHSSVIDAAAQGASAGVALAINVGAMLLAFISLIAMINGLLGWTGGLFGNSTLSMQQILGYLFAPVAWLTGIPWQEAVTAGGLIGEKVVMNEFIAYMNMSGLSQPLSPHASAILTFALCGFANFASIAIQLGLIGSIAPSRRGEVASLGLRSVLAGMLANLMSAAIAGFFMSLVGT